MTAVWIYTDTRHEVGHPDHLKVFADEDTAEQWFKVNDPEGVAFAYQVQQRAALKIAATA
jgi:hypothetical protein